MVLINITLLNMLWFASILGAANQMLWPAMLMLLLLLMVTFIYQGINKTDLKILALSLICGLLIDGFLAFQGIVTYGHTLHSINFLPPIWIMLLWIGFAATVRVGMQWLLNNPVIGGAFMLIGAPLSYFSAAKLDAVIINDLWQAMSFIGITWLLYFVALVQITQNEALRKNVVA